MAEFLARVLKAHFESLLSLSDLDQVILQVADQSTDLNPSAKPQLRTKIRTKELVFRELEGVHLVV